VCLFAKDIFLNKFKSETTTEPNKIERSPSLFELARGSPDHVQAIVVRNHVRLTENPEEGQQTLLDRVHAPELPRHPSWGLDPLPNFHHLEHQPRVGLVTTLAVVYPFAF
jgi:hypothetical protein